MSATIQRQRRVAATLTRPSDTNAYTAGDVVSNSTSTTTPITIAGLLTDAGVPALLIGARLTTSKKSITPRFRVHLYNAATATLSADNAAMQKLYADNSKYLGWFDLPAMTTPTDSTNSTLSEAQDLGLRIPLLSGTTSVFAVLETLDAFTPASAQTFYLELIALNN